jgi:hypothetical protein
MGGDRGTCRMRLTYVSMNLGALYLFTTLLGNVNCGNTRIAKHPKPLVDDPSNDLQLC